MEDLTFGEQVKIILGRKGMTIKELAEIIEERTGSKMSRQNLTQRLGRDNFQEQDMRMIANILECPFRLSILSNEQAAVSRQPAADAEIPTEQELKKVELKRQQRLKERELAFTEVQKPGEGDVQKESTPETDGAEVDMTIGELYEIHEELSEMEDKVEAAEAAVAEEREETQEEQEVNQETKEKFRTAGIFLRKKGVPAYEEKPDNRAPEPDNEPESDSDDFEPVIKHDDAEENLILGDVNPYTGREFLSNSVRMHPSRIGYVQVYDRATHKWTDMTEWAFLGYQERKKALLGKDYEPPIYLD